MCSILINSKRHVNEKAVFR